ncbi:hypothetical protein EV12_3083 [Prochlorococcus sp. MIT 0701]|nr:hypothetical protein EV12_3083 [Prochlorococcus sp. MIT 0701]
MSKYFERLEVYFLFHGLNVNSFAALLVLGMRDISGRKVLIA